MKLVLFDIDATLISTGAAGADAMRDVFAELCGIPDGFAGIEMSGKTDMAIFRPSEGNFWINGSKNGVSVIGWGTNGDVPIANAYVR